MPSNIVKTPEDEKVWRRAKAKAEEAGHKDDWPYITTIFESMSKKSALTDEDVDYYINKYYADAADPAHGVPHIQAVRSAASELAEAGGYRRKKLLDAAALLHDIGNKTDRATHAKVGADIVAKDKLLAERFSANDVKALIHAVKEHRASSGKPKSALAKLLSDSDRLSSFTNEGSSLARAYSYGQKHEPNLTHEQQLLRAASHQKEKYGPDGYGVQSMWNPEARDKVVKTATPAMKAYDAKDVKELNRLLELGKTAEVKLDINVGDVILGGRYKNKREVVETIGTDELGQPTINGKKLLSFRIEKKLPKSKWSQKTKELKKESVMNKLAFLEGYMEKSALNYKTMVDAALKRGTQATKARGLFKNTGNKAYRDMFRKLSNKGKNTGRIITSKALKDPKLPRMDAAGLMDLGENIATGSSFDRTKMLDLLKRV